MTKTSFTQVSRVSLLFYSVCAIGCSSHVLVGEILSQPEENGSNGNTQADDVNLAPVALVASNNLSDGVHLSWAAPKGSIPSGYVVQRDGVDIANVQGFGFVDSDALPGEMGPISEFAATHGTIEGVVRLSWLPPGGPQYRYTVIALYGAIRSEPSNTSLGRRVAPEVENAEYQFSRDNGITWESAGSGTSFDDPSPAMGTITAEARAKFVPSRGMVLSLTSAPTITPPPSVEYRLRVVTSTGPSAPTDPDSGFVGLGHIVSFQWQRSAADSAEQFTSLSGVTGAVWFDTNPVLESGRYYRVSMATAGAKGLSQSGRGEVSGVKRITVGNEQTCVTQNNNKTQCWSSVENGQALGIASETFKTFSSSAYHSCGVTTKDTVRCWGDNDYGEAPTTVSGKFKTVEVGWNFSCGLTLEGAVQCWGRNNKGQAPSKVAGNYKTLSAGYDHICGITSSNTVQCWGSNNFGQAPSTVEGTFKMVATAEHHSCGITTSNELRCWGQNNYGEAPPTTSGRFTAVALGEYHTCVITTAGEIQCWGDNEYGSVLDGVSGRFKAITATPYHLCAINSADQAQCWGNNEDYVELPVGISIDSYQLIDFAGSRPCGLRYDGHILCWGGDYPWERP